MGLPAFRFSKGEHPPTFLSATAAVHFPSAAGVHVNVLITYGRGRGGEVTFGGWLAAPLRGVARAAAVAVAVAVAKHRSKNSSVGGGTVLLRVERALVRRRSGLGRVLMSMGGGKRARRRAGGR